MTQLTKKKTLPTPVESASNGTGNNLLNKPNVALVMIPKSGKLTAIERKLLNSLLLASARQLREYRALHGQEPPNTFLYSAPASELLDPVEVGRSNLMSGLRKHVMALRRTVIDWEAPDAKSGIVWENLSMLSEARFEIRKSNLHVLWALPPKINTALLDYQGFHFTRLDLEKISRLKSYAAVALYEICARYRNNFRKNGGGICITNASPPEWWVDTLTNVTPKINKETGEPMRREWRKVKSEAVKKAIEEINAETDMDIVLTEKKQGKSVSLVQFEIRLKKSAPQELQSSHFDLIRQGLSLGVTEAALIASIDRTSAAQVALCLARLEARIKQQDLPPVTKADRYFSALIGKGPSIVLIPDAEERVKSSAVPVSPSVREPAVEPKKGLWTLAKESFMALPDAAKQVFADRAILALVKRGIASPKIQRNAKEGVWSGVILSQMIEIYAAENIRARASVVEVNGPVSGERE